MKKMILALSISAAVIGSAAFAQVVTPLPPIVEEDDDDDIIVGLPSWGLAPAGTVAAGVVAVGVLAVILDEGSVGTTTTTTMAYPVN